MITPLVFAALLGLGLATPAVVPEGTCANVCPDGTPPPCTHPIGNGPTWPNNFTAGWNEQTNYTGTVKYSGGSTTYIWGDGTNPALIWARWDGWADPYCNNSLPLPYDSQCQHIVYQHQRYLYYPILNQCCVCCNDAQGCGVPAPNFMQTLGAVYQGQGQYLGRAINYWGLPNNVTYVETTDPVPTSRQWAALWSPLDQYTNVWSWNIRRSAIQLPAKCSGATLCPAGPCLARRQASPAWSPILFN